MNTCRKQVERGFKPLLGIKTGVSVAGLLLTLMFLAGCRNVATPSAGQGGQRKESAPPVANRPVPDGQPTARQGEQEYSITPERMGPARLGSTVGELKRAMPAATYSMTILPDMPSAVAVRQGDEELFYFVTESAGETLPADDERISLLITKNPRYVTEAGIRPGSLLADAVKAYGAAQFYYSPDAEFAKFSSAQASRKGFLIDGPDGDGPAGIYQMKPENLEDGYYRSERFRPGSTVSYISISKESSTLAAPVVELFRPVLSGLKRETGIPVLLPSELPRALLERKIYVDGQGTQDDYSIALTSRPNCGANACTLGYFEAQRGGKPSFKKVVTLTQGFKGYYKPLSCGGSCSPPAIEWVAGGVLYSIQLHVSGDERLSDEEEASQMIRIANSSIEAGPR